MWRLKCNFERRQNITLGPQISATIAPDVVTDNGIFFIQMALFHSDRFERAIPSPVSLELGDRVFLQARMGQHNDLVIYFENCWATPNSSMTHHIRYDIVKQGCAKDSTLDMYQNGDNDTARFSYEAFKFRGSFDQVFIHCELLVCKMSDGSSR